MFIKEFKEQIKYMFLDFLEVVGEAHELTLHVTSRETLRSEIIRCKETAKACIQKIFRS